MHEVAERLERCTRAFGLTAAQVETLIRLDALLVRWSERMRLVGFRDAGARFERYFAEALAAAAFLPDRGRVVDVGSGAGSPAFPMAVRRPKLRWALLEPNRKKAVFLESAAAELGLGQIEVARVRLQDYFPVKAVSAVTSRAVAIDAAGLERMTSWVEPGGRILLITGSERAPVLVDLLRSLLGGGVERVSLHPHTPAQVVWGQKPSRFT